MPLKEVEKERVKMDEKQLIKAISCCAEFCCGECPYQKYDGGSEKLLKCIHKLMVDIDKYFKEKNNG